MKLYKEWYFGIYFCPWKALLEEYLMNAHAQEHKFISLTDLKVVSGREAISEPFRGLIIITSYTISEKPFVKRKREKYLSTPFIYSIPIQYSMNGQVSIAGFLSRMMNTMLCNNIRIYLWNHTIYRHNPTKKA